MVKRSSTLTFYQPEVAILTSIDQYAYKMNEARNSLFITIRTFEKQIIKTNDNFYVVTYPQQNSGFDSLSFIFQISI